MLARYIPVACAIVLESFSDELHGTVAACLRQGPVFFVRLTDSDISVMARWRFSPNNFLSTCAEYKNKSCTCTYTYTYGTYLQPEHTKHTGNEFALRGEPWAVPSFFTHREKLGCRESADWEGSGHIAKHHKKTSL